MAEPGKKRKSEPHGCKWADNYDIFSSEFTDDPFSLWDKMREGGCPVAHSDLWGGSWMPVEYDDIRQIARDPERFSSRAVEVGGPVPRPGGGLFIPPLTSDPPEHRSYRRLLQPYFTSQKIAELEPFVRKEARILSEGLAERGEGDAVGDFARHLTIAVLTRLLGVPRDNEERFIDWMVRLVRIGPQDQRVRNAVVREILDYFKILFAERRENPGDDLVSYVATTTAEINGRPLSEKDRLGMCFLILIAGADTTWSAIGASLWHLATYPEDRKRLVAEPDLMTSAVEELLRVYAPVTIARIAKEDVELHGRCIHAGERLILPFAAANRDPKVFEDPNEIRIDREKNRHITFGWGAHRCLGAGLAKLELRVSLEEWLRAMPDYYLTDPENITWSGGQVRGPNRVDFKVGERVDA
ncbi:cytochrome P450 [Rubrobacter xylanophilus]|uniref:Cytochrome P450 n=1 Tax=Rubrobacter xylanophilus TaxID=49319 RepID=A0A510HH53_9ACTN|nr:cytochrome P450 [Rubrobacter xylanophilus]BBL79281.1 cytochrome P450 [Rubrobacter xylanophilus]